MPWTRRLLLLAGVGAFGWMLFQVGPGVIFTQIRQLGWYFPLLFFPSALAMALDTMGWRYALGGKGFHASFDQLYRIRMAGEALNLITPTASLGGEPVKAYLLQRFRIPLEDGIASVVIAKTTLVISQIVFVLLGLAFALTRVDTSSPLMIALTTILTLGIPAIGIFFFIQHRGLFTTVLTVLRIFRLRIGYLEARAERLWALDQRITTFYREHRREFILSLLFHFLGWVVGTLEVWIALRLMGIPVGLATALTIEAIASVIKAAAFLIPGNVGMQEGSNLAIFTALGLSAAAGLAFSILRRLRELGWAALGLLVLSRWQAGTPLRGKEVG